jgi:hypothetical protein
VNCNECGRPIVYEIKEAVTEEPVPENLGPWDRAFYLAQSEQRKKRALLKEKTDE